MAYYKGYNSLYPYYKGSPCVTTEIITEKFDDLRGRLLGNHNEFLVISYLCFGL